MILASVPCRAHLRVTLVHQHTVNALRVDAARVLVKCLAVTSWNLREVSGDNLHLPNRPVYLRNRDKGEILTALVS